MERVCPEGDFPSLIFYGKIILLYMNTGKEGERERELEKAG